VTSYRGSYLPQRATTRQPEYELVVTPAYKRTKRPRFIPARRCRDCGELARSQYAWYCEACNQRRHGIALAKKGKLPLPGEVWGGVKILSRVRERVFLCECVRCGTVRDRFLSWLIRYRSQPLSPCIVCRSRERQPGVALCRICFGQPWRRATPVCRRCGEKHEEEEIERCYDQRKNQ